jgi:hypothetical protein
MEKSTDNRSSVVEVLKQASEGLLFTSESEYPFEVFFWPEGREDINSEMILQRAGHPPNTSVKFVDLDSFFAIATTAQSWHDEKERDTVKKYQHLAKTLKENLIGLKVAYLGKINMDVYIIGKTTSGNLAGLSTKVVET